jgi:hypothetical protein
MRYGQLGGQTLNAGTGFTHDEVTEVRARTALPPKWRGRSSDGDRTFIDTTLPWQIAQRAELDTVRGVREQARRFLDEVIAAQLTLAVNLDALESALDAVAYDRAAHAAADTMRSRLDELREISDALEALHLVAAHPDLVRLFHEDAPLADYLRGLEAFCNGVVRAFEQLAVELRVPAPDWAMLRRRLDESKQFYLPELTHGIRVDIERLRAQGSASTGLVDRLEDALNELCATAEWFAMCISRRFG